MKPVREVVTREIIDDLWGAGYTILPRRRHADPFFVSPEMIPQGRAYQWMHLIHDKDMYSGRGWAAVPASRHDGYFMPAGFIGDIEVNGLGLFEKPKFEVDAERKEQINAAYKLTDDWMKKWSGELSGESALFGEVKIGETSIKLGDGIFDVEQAQYIDGKTKTIETTTAIPRDMVPYIDQIFEERDRLSREAIKAYGIDKSLSKLPTLSALVLPAAINNIRQRIIEETKSGQTS